MIPLEKLNNRIKFLLLEKGFLIILKINSIILQRKTMFCSSNPFCSIISHFKNLVNLFMTYCNFAIWKIKFAFMTLTDVLFLPCSSVLLNSQQLEMMLSMCVSSMNSLLPRWRSLRIGLKNYLDSVNFRRKIGLSSLNLPSSNSLY